MIPMVYPIKIFSWQNTVINKLGRLAPSMNIVKEWTPRYNDGNYSGCTLRSPELLNVLSKPLSLKTYYDDFEELLLLYYTGR
jgi:hypothetical protein